MSFFQHVSVLPEDPIFSQVALYARDERAHKVNLGIGIYKDNSGKSTVFNAVSSAEQLLQEKHLNKDYLQIDGDPSFRKEVLKLIFGELDCKQAKTTVYGAQCVGGTSALTLGLKFLVQKQPRQVFISEVSWANHFQIFESLNIDYHTYPYTLSKAGELEFDKIVKSFESIPAGSIVMLHACCHNPTGVDFSLEQWQELSELIKKRNLLPFFDCAYQGFGSEFTDDAAAMRLFYEQEHEMLVAYSCSKNFGLYGERVGLLAVVSKEKDIAHITSHIKMQIRTNYSNPPIHGSRIVTTILESELLKETWLRELHDIRVRCQNMRVKFAAGLEGGINSSFITTQKGLFSVLSLKKESIIELRERFGVYMPSSGRINIAALTDANVGYVCNAIIECL